MNIETHPLEPFLPSAATVLMLGSFPPPQHRWKMPFYYPNFNNDMWRIFGLVFFGDRDYFIDAANKCFYQAKIERFLQDVGIAIADSAHQVVRLADNASDKFLQLVAPTDMIAILDRLPACCTILITGEKSGEILWQTYGDGQSRPPKVGGSSTLTIGNRSMTVYRLPSSSRAYPLALAKKAAIYQAVFTHLALIKLPVTSL